MLISKTWY